MYEEIVENSLYVPSSQRRAVLAASAVQSSLYWQIVEAQRADASLAEIVKMEGVTIDDNCVVRLRGRLFVPVEREVKQRVLEEAHKSRYTIHPGSTKMYHDLRKHFWWPHMKKEIAEFVARCAICQ